MTTIQELAGEAFGEFTQTQRGEETITVLRDTAPDWVRDAAHDAHGDMFPDDWRYDRIQDAFGAIHDAGEGSDITEVGDEFADGAVDIYTAARFAWLASNLNRQYYCDDAITKGLVGEDADLVTRIGIGQYMEAREIFAAVLSALESELEAREDAEA